MKRYSNRREAGRMLGEHLAGSSFERPIVLALPRGGVPVGYEVALTLSAPLDIWIVRKLGVPWRPELGLGAISETGLVHVFETLQRQAGIGRAELAGIVERGREEVADYSDRFRGSRPPPDVRGRSVILVDDGIATGGTVVAAARSLRTLAPREIVLATPVAAPQAALALRSEVDRVVCLRKPDPFHAVGLWYDDFDPVSDAEVVQLLSESWEAIESEEP